jgi:succinyl-CoA synthetase alpha subunit
MSILIDRETRLLVQGITGREGEFHARAMQTYGTNVVAGMTPGKGGQRALDGTVPVFNTVAQAVSESGANASCIFVPGSCRRRHSCHRSASRGRGTRPRGR